MSPRIALIHAVPMAIEPVNRALAELWPEARPVNIMDDALSPDREAEADLHPLLAARIEALADYAVMAAARGILYTCSAFGPAIDRVKARLDIPVLKPNEAMFEAALRLGSRIGMVATFAPSVASMEDEFAALAQARGTDARLETQLVAEAMRALRGGDADRHNTLVADAAARLDHCDAIMLAHFSTSVAYPLAQQRVKNTVLTSPRSAVLALRDTLTRA